MKTRTMIVALATAAASGCFLLAPNAEAYCTVGQANLGVPGYTFAAASLPVPVYLVDDGGNVFGQSPSAVARAVGRTVDVVNRYGMSAFTVRYGGVLTTAAAAVHAGPGIYLRENTSCNACGGASACTLTPVVNGAGNVSKINIQLVYNAASCSGIDWQFYPDYAACVPGACADDFQAVLTHELLHAAGLAHCGSLGNCTPGDNGSEGIMSGNGGTQYTEQRYPSRDDVDGLIALYGRRFGTLDYHYSYDGGLSWTDGGLLGNTASRSPLGSVSTATDDETNLYFAYQANQASYIPYSRSMDFSATSAVAQLGALAMLHPVPVAFGNGTLVAPRFVDSTRTNNSKALRWAWSENGGTTWSSADAVFGNGSNVRTRRNGLSAAFDPATSQFIAAYVGDNNLPDGNDTKCDDTVQGDMCDEVRIATLDPTTGEQHHTNLGVRTAVAPSIACGVTANLRNCVVTWVSTTANACVHWGHGRILGDGSFELYNDLSTGCIQGYGDVAVSYDDTEAANPWRISLTQEVVGNDNRIYTFRKGSGYSDAWVDQRSFVVSGGFRTSGGLGLLKNALGTEKLQVMYLRN